MDNRRKVCYITTVHPVFDTRIFHKEAKTLVDAGYNVILIAQHDKGEIIDGIKIIPLARMKNRLHRTLFSTIEAYRLALRQKADIYHFHDPELIFVGFLLKLFTKKKVIYDIHENVSSQILAKEWIPQALRLPAAHVYSFFEKIVVHFFDIVIVAGDDIKLSNKEVIVVKNYPFKEMTVSSVFFKKVAGKKFHCIYVGILSEDRCVKEMIRSLKYVEYPVLLTFIGSPKDKKYLENLKRLASAETSHCVDFIAPLSHQETMNHLGSAEAGLVLLRPKPNNISAVSRNNKLYEYMANGLPVIASNFPLWKDVVEGNNCGICVDPLSLKEIAGAIGYLASHPEEAKKMGENGRKLVLERYNWEDESKKLLKAYKLLA